MRILIFEPDSTGHRLHYVRHMVLAFSELPVEIVVALSTDAPARPEFSTQLGDIGELFSLETCIEPPPRGVLQGAAHRVAMLQRSIARAKPDRLYVPSVDGLGQILGVRRTLGLAAIPPGLPTEGLTLRGGFCYPQDTASAALKAKAAWWLGKRARWDVLHILDPLVFAHVAANDPRLAQRSRLMPDPVEIPERDDRLLARRELGIAQDGRYVACVGHIDNRKGCDRLLAGFAAATSLRPTDRLLLAGPQQPEISRLLSAEPIASLIRAGRIICINRTLSTEELMQSIEAADLIAALYPRHIGSASIAIRAAAAKRPVLAGNYGWLGAIVPRFDLGRTTDLSDTAGLAAAISSALDGANDFRQSELARRFVNYHKVENFRAHWAAALREQLQLPPSADHVAWESVSQ